MLMLCGIINVRIEKRAYNWYNIGKYIPEGNHMENEEKKVEKGNSATDVLGALVKQLSVMWIAIFVLIVLLVGTNMAWLYVFQSYDYVTQDGDGQNYYNREVGGDVYNGAESQGEKEGEEEQGN